MKLKRVRFSNGERYSLLECANGMPHFLATLWTTVELRPANLQVASISNHLQNLKRLLDWESAEGRDLYSEFHQKKFLSENDVESIRKYLSLDINHQKAISKAKRKIVSLKSFPQLVDATPTVSPRVLYNRISTATKYLTFIAKVATAQSYDDATMQAIQALNRQLNNLRPKRGKNKKTIGKPTDTGIPKNVIDEFISVSRFDSSLNPFSNEQLRLRNDLLFRLLEETGIRPGELLSLRNDRVNLKGDVPSITVARTHDDPFDPRKKQPVAKTLERVIQIKPLTASLMHEYITKYRKKIAGAGKHPYLFVAHKGRTSGQPLTQEGFGQVVKEIKKTKPQFAVIFPYYFRHHYNDVLSDKIDKNNELSRAGVDGYVYIDSDKEAKIRKQQMGHSSESSAEPYIQRHVKKEANKLQLKDIKEMDSTLKEVNKSVEAGKG